ncbi:SDR family oxidoreductase [Geminicoccus harenae]|uniref:SDR family oxidoreductase n=1 Tax=Geminicoccus harenae TaxID=2498453 RepID=UPI00168BEBF3|nr:SDR family oxidoreductase [Geminicoccus harenae]
MAGRVADRVAVVFGAARGIGAAVATRLAEEGAKVWIADRRVEGQATAKAIGGRYLACDLAVEADIQGVIDTVLAEHGRLDICVQNAGIFPETLIDGISAAEWDQVLGVNLRGSFLAVRAAFAPMKRQRYGRIVLTSSITGPRVVPPGHAHYAASKAGLNGLIRAAALEGAPFGITVNGIEPGNVLTEGMQSERSQEFIDGMARAIPLGRLAGPRDVAHAFLFLASDEAAYITGTTIVVDGGQTLPEGKA